MRKWRFFCQTKIIERSSGRSSVAANAYHSGEKIKDGMIADVNIYDKEDGNPHAHIMLTTRKIEDDTFGEKNRYWNKKEKVLEWRENWGEEANQVFQNKGETERIDHRSYKEQGIEIIPQTHMGHEATAMERRGIKTYKGNINRAIVEQNENIKKLKKINGYTGEIQKTRKNRENASAKQENRLDPPKITQKPNTLHFAP